MTQPPKQLPELPQWMTEPQTHPPQTAGRTRLHFLRGTMRHIAELFENDLSSEKYARLPLYLQSVDARAKTIAFLFFIVFGSLVNSAPALLSLAAVPLLYASVSGLKLRSFVRRVWGLVPLLAFLFALPGASSLLTQGKPLLTIIPADAPGFSNGLYFSAAGLWSAARIGLRTGISLSFAALLLLTTRWSSLTGGLAVMRVPALLISVLNMAYRYLFVMARTALELMQARFLRSCGKLGTSLNRRFMGHSAAFLFLKSHYLSEEIYSAMCCRGYSGRPAGFQQRKMTANDAVFLFAAALIFLILLAEELLF